jgi:hypothetical protein
VASGLGVLRQDPGVPTSAEDGLWYRHLRNSLDLEPLAGDRYVVGTSNREVVVGQTIRDPRNAAEGGDLVAT